MCLTVFHRMTIPSGGNDVRRCPCGSEPVRQRVKIMESVGDSKGVDGGRGLEYHVH